MTKHISQRTAQFLRKRVAALEERERGRNRAWSSEYPGGVHIATEQFTVANYAVVQAALKLGHAVVLKPSGKDDYVYVFGVKVGG